MLVSVAKYDGLGLEWIVNSGAKPFVEVATHAPAYWRRDIDGGQAGLKWCGLNKDRAEGDRCRCRGANEPAHGVTVDKSPLV